MPYSPFSGVLVYAPGFTPIVYDMFPNSHVDECYSSFKKQQVMKHVSQLIQWCAPLQCIMAVEMRLYNKNALGTTFLTIKSSY